MSFSASLSQEREDVLGGMDGVQPMGLGGCQILVQERDGEVVVRVEGRGTMLQSPTVKQFAERCLTGSCRTLRLDLSRCNYLDSTFIGTLLFLQRKHGHAIAGRFGLLNPSPECSRILREMGVEELVPIGRHGASDEGDWAPLTMLGMDPCALRANVMQAHQELAKTPGSCGEQFRGVAACLGDTPTP